MPSLIYVQNYSNLEFRENMLCCQMISWTLSFLLFHYLSDHRSHLSSCSFCPQNVISLSPLPDYCLTWIPQKESNKKTSWTLESKRTRLKYQLHLFFTLSVTWVNHISFLRFSFLIYNVRIIIFTSRHVT